jgi:hypothetical protein
MSTCYQEVTMNLSIPFPIRVSPEFLEKIDQWRVKQPDIPTRAESIRRLVEKALELEHA